MTAVVGNRISLIHIFVDHSNIWGGARGATRVRRPEVQDDHARVSVRRLDAILGGRRQGVTTKIVSGGIPPGMEPLWEQYARHGYDTQRLFRDKQWKERGVDHTIIGHMWRLMAKFRTAPTILVLASGDGKQNEFNTSFYEILQEILRHRDYESWSVHLASFDWRTPEDSPIRSPTSRRMRKLVDDAPRGEFINLMDHYDPVVYIEA